MSCTQPPRANEHVFLVQWINTCNYSSNWVPLVCSFDSKKLRKRERSCFIILRHLHTVEVAQSVQTPPGEMIFPQEWQYVVRVYGGRKKMKSVSEKPWDMPTSGDKDHKGLLWTTSRRSSIEALWQKKVIQIWLETVGPKKKKKKEKKVSLSLCYFRVTRSGMFALAPASVSRSSSSNIKDV